MSRSEAEAMMAGMTDPVSIRMVKEVIAFAYSRAPTSSLDQLRAAEICEYLTDQGTEPSVEVIRDIFMSNARYKKQADHIVSMVPVLLINAGYPKDAAMNIVPLLRAAANEIPR